MSKVLPFLFFVADCNSGNTKILNFKSHYKGCHLEAGTEDFPRLL